MKQKDYITDKILGASGQFKDIDPASVDTIEKPSVVRAREAKEKKEQERLENISERRIADGERAKSDLAARISRDLGMIDAEVDKLSSRKAGLIKVHEIIFQQNEELKDKTAEKHGKEFSREVDRLRVEYFRTMGTLESLKDCGTTTNSRKDSFEQFSNWELIKKSAAVMWLPALAIFVGSLIVAGAIILIFR